MATGFVGFLKSPFNLIVQTTQKSSQVARNIYNIVSENTLVSTITGLAKFCFIGLFKALTWAILRRRYVESPQRRRDLESICAELSYDPDYRAALLRCAQQVTASVPNTNGDSRVPTDLSFSN